MRNDIKAFELFLLKEYYDILYLLLFLSKKNAFIPFIYDRNDEFLLSEFSNFMDKEGYYQRIIRIIFKY